MRLKYLFLSILIHAIVLFPLMAEARHVSDEKRPSAQRIEITAMRFSFQPDEITLKKGQPVTLMLTTEDVTHGLAVEELGIKVTAKKGHPGEVTVTPDKIGEFQGECSVFCGMGHGSMRMTVKVTE
jgi:cytochrome c oxidase subunit 2